MLLEIGQIYSQHKVECSVYVVNTLLYLFNAWACKKQTAVSHSSTEAEVM